MATDTSLRARSSATWLVDRPANRPSDLTRGASVPFLARAAGECTEDVSMKSPGLCRGSYALHNRWLLRGRCWRGRPLHGSFARSWVVHTRTRRSRGRRGSAVGRDCRTVAHVEEEQRAENGKRQQTEDHWPARRAGATSVIRAPLRMDVKSVCRVASWIVSHRVISRLVAVPINALGAVTVPLEVDQPATTAPSCPVVQHIIRNVAFV
jgi:hypothetical protein